MTTPALAQSALRASVSCTTAPQPEPAKPLEWVYTALGAKHENTRSPRIGLRHQG